MKNEENPVSAPLCTKNGYLDFNKITLVEFHINYNIHFPKLEEFIVNSREVLSFAGRPVRSSRENMVQFVHSYTQSCINFKL